MPNNILRMTGVGGLLDDLTETIAKNQFSGYYAVGSPAVYSIHQEYGTYAQSGTPHLRPGMDAAVAQHAQIAANASSLEDYMRKMALAGLAETKSRAPVDTGYLQGSYQVTRG